MFFYFKVNKLKEDEISLNIIMFFNFFMRKRVQCKLCGCWYNEGLKCPRCSNQIQMTLKKFGRSVF